MLFTLAPSTMDLSANERETMKRILGIAAAVSVPLLFLVLVTGVIKGPPEQVPSICPVIIYEDGTWVEDGWDATKGFPPVGCVLTARTSADR